MPGEEAESSSGPTSFLQCGAIHGKNVLYPHLRTYPVRYPCLGISFSNSGLPVLIVSGNGTCFKSEKFEEFLKRNGILHVPSTPYHGFSNGLAEMR